MSPAGPCVAPAPTGRWSWLEWALSRQSSVVIGLAVVALVVAVVRTLVVWPDSRGHEYEVIAWAVARGHGFSFSSDWRWLFVDSWNWQPPVPGLPKERMVPGEDASYFPTAWEEPLPVYALAAAFWLFGDTGRLVMSMVNAVVLAVTVWVVYCIGRRLPLPGAGLAAALILTFQPIGSQLVATLLANSLLGALALALVTLATLRCIEVPSLRRGAALGLALGIATQTTAATLVLLPVVLGALLVLPTAPWRQRLGPAMLALTVAAATVTPWIVRNHAVFDEFVLVRNGAGVNLYFGNPGLAKAAVGVGEESSVGLAEAAEAWNRVIDRLDERTRIYNDSAVLVEQTAPSDWPSYNETQRDKVYLDRALEFMLDNPWTTIALTLAKFRTFILPTKHKSLLLMTFVSLLALIGFVAVWRRREAWLLALLILAYVALFSLTQGFAQRYRFPIEPLIAVLGGAGLVAIVATGARWLPARFRLAEGLGDRLAR